MFPQDLPDIPPRRDIDHTIHVEEHSVPPLRRPYRLSPKELLEVEKVIDELISKGYIEESSSPYASPVLFVPKPDGTLRFCIDFRALNK